MSRLRRPFALLAALITAGFSLPALAQSPAAVDRPHHPDRVIVKFKATVSEATRQSIHGRAGTALERKLRAAPDVELRRVDHRRPLAAVIAEYEASGLVEYAEPDFEIHASAVPNDPGYAQGLLWPLDNTGQNAGTVDADIDAREAWDTRTATGAIVAVVDTGIRYTHEDLAANMWRNAGEIPGNGIDDDGDGYIDDVYGINAITGSGDPMDDAGHGTHVAGTIAAVGNNGKGITGVAWSATLMAVKCLAADGSGYGSDAVEAVDYARVHGATVINISWGGPTRSQAIYDALARCRSAGIVVAVAAGNETANNDTIASYPANYALDNIVSVAATTRTDALAPYSNFGANTVHLGAPGDHIVSTYFSADNAYGEMSGTSMAAPHVAGALALLRAQFPTYTYTQIIGRLLSTVDTLPGLAGKTLTGGRLNLARALAPVATTTTPPATTTTPPVTTTPVVAAPANLAAAVTSTAVTLNWTDASTDETGFEVERAAASGTFARIGTTAANVHTFTDAGVSAGSSYNYRVRAITATAASAYSNTATANVPAATSPSTPAPAAWQSKDIGAVAATGRTGVNGSVYTVTGSGADVWGTADECQFYYQALNGDGEIVARVNTLDNTDAWAKAGLMIRTSLDAGAANVFLFANPSFVVGLQQRLTNAAVTTSPASLYRWPPAWLKLVRAGNVVSAYYSADGATWTLAQAVTLTLPATVYAGMTVTSHHDGTLCNASFDNVKFAGAASAIAPAPTTTAPAPTTAPVAPMAPTTLAGTATSSSVTLTWHDNSTDEAGFEIERSPDGVTFTRIQSVAANTTTATDNGLTAATTYRYRVRAVAGSTASSYSNVLALTTNPATTVPPPPASAWNGLDVGKVGPAGTNSGVTAGAVTITAAGEDIWGASDGFYYLWQPLHGDGQIIARVDSLDKSDAWAKAGVMIRESTAANARHAFVFLTPDLGANVEARAASGGSTVSVAGPWWVDPPYWVKLVRSGSTFMAYTSADGVTWTLTTTQSMPMVADTCIGLAVTAHTTARTTTARFSNVQVSAAP